MKKMLIACVLLLTAGCSLLQPAPDLAWDHDPEARILSVTDGGGLQPEAAYYNDIPRAVVWGNGRIIHQTRGDDHNRLVWQGQLSEQEMADLLQTFADKGFFRLDAFYRPKDEVYDSSTTSLHLHLLAGSYRVSEYHEGAPRKFHELVGLVSSGAGVEGTAYVPQSGYLTALYTEPWDSMGDDIPIWDADALGLNLDDAIGIWVKGDALAQAWTAVNRRYWSPLIQQGDDYYELYLEIPDLTGREPR